MKKFLTFLIWGLVLILAFIIPVSADMGFVPPPDIWVYEPGQKAIVAWNGTDEIIILSVDLYSTDDATVLSILPLPNEPKAEEGNFESFIKVQQLLDQYNYIDGWGITPLAGGEKATSVEVIFHEKIGAHDITVVKAMDTNEFINWANGFLTGKGVDFQISSPEVENAVSDYIARDINYFVFDLTDISIHTKSREPIVYSFKSDSLYFPLKISSLAEGVTSINLFTISYDQPKEVKFSTIGFEEPVQFTITSEDLFEIDERIGNLFESTTWLTAASYNGNLDYLSYDLEVRPINETRVLHQQLEDMEARIESLKEKITDLTSELQKIQQSNLTWLITGIVIGALFISFLFVMFRKS